MILDAFRPVVRYTIYRRFLPWIASLFCWRSAAGVFSPTRSFLLLCLCFWGQTSQTHRQDWRQGAPLPALLRGARSSPALHSKSLVHPELIFCKTVVPVHSFAHGGPVFLFIENTVRFPLYSLGSFIVN